jgi:hypothetical protein
MSGTKKMLASHGSFGCVYECSCGTFHVAVGPVDLKFTRASLLETYALLAEAVQQLEPDSPEIEEAAHLTLDDNPHLYAN